MALTKAQTDHVLAIIAGMFDVAPGANNLSGVADYYEVNGYNDVQLADWLATNQAYQELFAGKVTVEAQADQIMKNFDLVHGTTAGENAYQYFVNQLSQGVSTQQLILNAVDYLESPSHDPMFDEAAQTLNNKVDVSYEYSVVAGKNGATYAELHDVVANVTADPASVQEAIKKEVYGAHLTSDIDNVSGEYINAHQAYTPGGDDLVNALQSGDTIHGMGSDAVLDVALGNPNDAGGRVILPTITGVHEIDVADHANVAMTLNLEDADSALDTVNLTRIDGVAGVTMNVSDMNHVVHNLGVANTEAGAIVNFTYLDNALAGTNDAVNLSLENANLSTLMVNSVNGTQGVEALTIDSEGAGNTIGNLVTTDLRDLTLTGAADLTIANITNTALNQALTNIDGTALTGNLNLEVPTGAFAGNIPGTSGADVAMTVNLGGGDDRLGVSSQIGENDTVHMGAGNDTLDLHSNTSTNFFQANTNNQAQVFDVENVTLRVDTNVTSSVVTHTIDFQQMDGDQLLKMTNSGKTSLVGSTSVWATYNLNNASAAEATGLTITHSATGDNALGANRVNLDVASGVNTAGITIVNGVNTDPRFNFTFNADSDRVAGNATNTVANVNITDSDSESNTVQLGEYLRHTGTITLAGGQTGQFMNLDASENVMRYDRSGGAADGAGFANTVGTNTGALVAANFDATAYAGNVVARFATNPNSAVGAQDIKMGSGNDMVIFDNLADTKAGLTISDSVSAGAGNDTLAFGGNVNVTLGASEWTHVSGFETLQLLGNGLGNSYALRLTDQLIQDNNYDGTHIHIVNDNDPANDAVNGTNTLGTGNESAVTIDARALSANLSFTYNGEEGATATNDRFILNDVTANGLAVIDGGAASNTTTPGVANLANGDVLEIRDAAVVTTGDLANVSNVGTISFTNDTATVQTSQLYLNDQIIDQMVNSYHTAATSAGNVEVLNITASDNATLPTATTAVVLDASNATSGATAINAALAGGNDTVIGTAGNDVINGGNGTDSLTGGAGNDVFSYTLGQTYGNDVLNDWGATGAGTDQIQVTATTSSTINVLSSAANAANVTITMGDGIAQNITAIMATAATYSSTGALVAALTGLTGYVAGSTYYYYAMTTASNMLYQVTIANAVGTTFAASEIQLNTIAHSATTTAVTMGDLVLV